MGTKRLVTNKSSVPLFGVRSFRYKVVSKSIQSDSTFMFSTVSWSDWRKNGNPAKPMKMLPTAHSYENIFNTRFFWGAGQKLPISLTSKCLRILFMITSFRVESLNNKLSDMNTVVFRCLEPNLVSIEFASLKLYNFTPDFSNLPFLETPDNSNQFWLPWNKLTPDNSNRRKFPNHLVRISITFTPLRWLYILFFKGLKITCA